MKLLIPILFCAVVLWSCASKSTDEQHYHSDALHSVMSFDPYRPIGVAVSSDNRLFVSFPKRDKDYLYGLVEVVNGEPVAFPNKALNGLEGADEHAFVSVQDLYIDDLDNLWVLDSKPSPGGSIFGNTGEEAAKEGHFKLLKINLTTGQTERVYTFDDLDKVHSGLNDVRVDTKRNLAYLSDPGLAAIVVLDLQTGRSRALLGQSTFTTADQDIVLSYRGKEMRDADGNPFRSNVNGIALTKDFEYFYFKPINKKELFRIKASLLADTTLSEEVLRSKVENRGDVGVTHGLEVDAKGNVFLSTSLDYSVKYMSPDGQLHTLVQDDRLLWPDSFGIGTDGYLYFSCAQLMHDAVWNDGVAKTMLPYEIFKVRLP